MLESNSELSEREKEILRLVATGASNKEIAQQLVISPNTVKVHLRNIFAKIGVASRTEATLFALQNGYAQVPARAGEPAPSGPEALVEAPAGAPARRSGLTRRSLVIGSGALMLIAVLALSGLLWRPAPFLAGGAAVSSPTPVVWEAKAPMPTARHGMAAVVYENQIYAIAGETASGVTGTVERYDPATDRWEALSPKPLPVADVQAAVLGGRLYVPGGRLAGGQVTDRLDVYNPREDAWEQQAPLPFGLSAYALAAFEGKLYVFGGWDGHASVASVFVYDPDEDRWSQQSALPTARSAAAATVNNDRIYIVGGQVGDRPVAIAEEYAPALDQAGGAPWRRLAGLPQDTDLIEAVNVADTLYAVGTGRQAGQLTLFKYLAAPDEWQAVGVTALPARPARVAVIGTRLHLLGGESAQGPVSQNLTYQAAYLFFLPIVSPGTQ
jgi:DNA-binding CsgD family transcriptional regulator